MNDKSWVTYNKNTPALEHHRPCATAKPTTEPNQVDFLAETDHFIHALKEGLKSLVGGLELRGMDSETRESSEDLDTRNFSQVGMRACAREELAGAGTGELPQVT